MDAELKALLEENLRVSRDTNELLKTMNRQAWWSFWGKVVLFFLVVILPLLLLPMVISQFLSTIPMDGQSQGFDMESLQKLIDQYKVE